MTEAATTLTVPALNLSTYFRARSNVFGLSAQKPTLTSTVAGLGRSLVRAIKRHDLDALVKGIIDLSCRYEDRGHNPLLMQSYVEQLNLDDVKSALSGLLDRIYQRDPYALYSYLHVGQALTHRPDLLQQWIEPDALLALTDDGMQGYIAAAEIAQHMNDDVKENFASRYLDARARSLKGILYRGKPTADVPNAWFSIQGQLRDLEWMQRSIQDMPLLAQMMHPQFIGLMKTVLLHGNPKYKDSSNNTPLDAYAEAAVVSVGFPALLEMFEPEEIEKAGRMMIEHGRWTAFGKLKSAFRDEPYKHELLENLESAAGVHVESIPNRMVMNHKGGSACLLDMTLMFNKSARGSKAMQISTYLDYEAFVPVKQRLQAWDKELKEPVRSIGGEYYIECIRAALAQMTGQAQGYDYAILPDGPRNPVPAFVKDEAAKQFKAIEDYRHRHRDPQTAGAIRAHFKDTRGGVKTYRPAKEPAPWRETARIAP